MGGALIVLLHISKLGPFLGVQNIELKVFFFVFFFLFSFFMKWGMS